MDNLIATLGLGPDTDQAELEPRVVTATVAAANADAALLRFTRDGKTVTGVMPVTEFLPGRKWEEGDVLTALACDDSDRPLLSMARAELVPALLAGVSPEVRSGTVRVMGVARRPGQRVRVLRRLLFLRPRTAADVQRPHRPHPSVLGRHGDPGLDEPTGAGKVPRL